MITIKVYMILGELRVEGVCVNPQGGWDARANWQGPVDPWSDSTAFIANQVSSVLAGLDREVGAVSEMISFGT